MRHRRALITIATASGLDLVGGLVFAHLERTSALNGIYWAVATATTVGYGDVVPHHTASKVLAIVVMLSIIPLVSATFSLFTSGLTATHLERHTRNVHDRLEHLRHHLGVPPYPERGQ